MNRLIRLKKNRTEFFRERLSTLTSETLEALKQLNAATDADQIKILQEELIRESVCFIFG